MSSLLDRLRLAPRLALGFALVLLLMSLAVGLGMWRLAQLRTIADELGGASAERALLARELHAIVVISAERAETLLVVDNADYAKHINEIRKGTSARSTEVRKRLEALSDTEAGQALYQQIDVAGEAFRKARDTLVKQREGGTPVSAADAQRDLQPAAAAYAKAVDDYAQFERDTVLKARDAADASASAGRTLLTLSILLGVGLSALLAWLISRSIVAPLQAASELAGRVAEGDLTSTPPRLTSRDEVQALVGELAGMQGKLAGLVQNIQQISDSVATASGEIATGNADLSQRTEQTASSLQQTASAMDQLTQAVSHSSESARHANELASSACDVATRGGEVVGQVVSTMGEISASSRRIADIIGTIDGIAFQTNILALNAAVEAARAGEQGRGFAVVASEVRSLAQRSAEAAKEIKTLIGSSVERVEVGARLVESAGATMGEIVASVQRVRDIIGEISTAATKQGADIGQIGQSVTQLDQMTQQNAALVEESAAAAESLREHALQLAGMVQTFRVAGSPRRY
ncbi:MAG: HAMP domain-containing protein [Pelomonas sp.]|nr:HAMP domain-containing protein [Roseateles sp.]MBV8604383.1 HAMP domain-containing protein [Roseateles sp.]